MSNAATQFSKSKSNARNFRNIISIHVGKCGARIGSTIWELFRHQHGVSDMGTLIDNDEHVHHYDMRYMFREVSDGISTGPQYVPNCIFVDCNSTTIDQIMTSRAKDFFEPSKMIHSYNHSRNFAHSRKTESLCMEACHQLRLMFEASDIVTSSFFTRGAAGACGSGLLPALAQYTNHRSKNYVLEVAPSQSCSYGCAESLNYIFGTVFTTPVVDAVIPFSNDCLYKKIMTTAGPDQVPTYYQMNQLVARFYSNLTNFRLGSTKGFYKGSMENLCPFPELKFLTPGMAPMSELESEQFTMQYSLSKLSRHLMMSSNDLMESDDSGKYICCSLKFEGETNDLHGVYQALDRHENFFVSWHKKAITISCTEVCLKDPEHWVSPKCPVKGFKIANHTGIMTHYLDWLDKYCQLFRRGAYLKGFLDEGMELTDFQEAFESMKRCCDSYSDLLVSNELDQE